jgi:tocopherol cyclase
MSLHSLYHPEIFQGNLKNTNYFEGWYFKQVSDDFTEVLSIIPGISLTSDPHAFIQVIDGVSGITHYIDYPISEFHADSRKLILQIGENLFKKEGIDLNINKQGLHLTGKLRFVDPVTWPRHVWAPGIMGWYSFVPGMECYHAVVSLDHTVTGDLTYQGHKITFNHGRGYIEKDWGNSMPESWIWLHTNTFKNPGSSVMLSIAKIPWRKSYFIGFIAFVLHGGKIFKFATYNGSRILDYSLLNQDLKVTLENPDYRLDISAHQKIAGKLKAPVNGLMERYIKESIDSDVEIRLSNHSNSVIFAGAARRSGLELVGNPESLIMPPVK